MTIVDRPANWDLEKTTVEYTRISLRMDEIRDLCRHTADRARKLLYEDLMFGASHVLKLKPRDLRDSDKEQVLGWWFGQHDRNSSLKGSENVLVENVASTPELRDLYLEEKADGNGGTRLFWWRSGIRLYLQLVPRLEKVIV